MQEKDLKEKEICDCEEAEEKAEAVVEEETKEDTKKEDKKASKFSKKKKIEELEEEIIKLKEEVAASKNAYFKAYADAENLKKRLQADL